MAKKLRSHLRDHLIPHEGNGFKPLLFTATGVGAVIVALLLVQAAYFLQTRIVFMKTDFLASVLPGVLATLTNEDRAAAGISAVTEDAHLARAAQMKADDMAAKGYFAHVDPEGHQPWYWLDQAGYDYAYAGENLAVNFTDSEEVQDAWMASPTHHANIVKAQYTRIGIGVAQGMYQGKETTFVVQFFATPHAVAAAPRASVPLEVQTAPSSDAVDTEEESQVLGAEIGAAAEPQEERAPETTNQPAPEPVAPASVSDSKEQALGFFAQVAASPTHTVIYVLIGLTGLLTLLLLIAIAVHIRVQYLEVVGGGLVMVAVALSLLVFNATGDMNVVVPADGQPASAIGAF